MIHGIHDIHHDIHYGIHHDIHHDTHDLHAQIEFLKGLTFMRSTPTVPGTPEFSDKRTLNFRAPKEGNRDLLCWASIPRKKHMKKQIHRGAGWTKTVVDYIESHDSWKRYWNDPILTTQFLFYSNGLLSHHHQYFKLLGNMFHGYVNSSHGNMHWIRSID